MSTNNSYRDDERDEEGFIILKPKASRDRTEAPAAAGLKKKTGKKKKPHKKGTHPKKPKLLYWHYDDKCTMGSVLCDKDSVLCDKDKDKDKNYKLFSNESEIDKYEKGLREKGVKKYKDCELPVGIEHYSDAYLKFRCKVNLDLSDFEQFQKLILAGESTDVRRSVLKIVCVILSSYLIRPMLKLDDILETYRLDEKEQLRALCVHVSVGENAFYVLKRICESMIVCTAVDDDDWSKLRVPTVISPDVEQSILESANLRVRGCKEDKWPAPYRDMSVLLDLRTLKAKDIKNFSLLNPWCSCIIYGKKVDLLGYGERIKGDVLSTVLPDWNAQKVNRLAEAYVATLPALFNERRNHFIKLWLQSGTYLSHHLERKKGTKMQDAERFKKRVEVTALLSFLKFTKENCAVSDEAMEQFQNYILDILLPGCILLYKDNSVAVSSLSSREVFEEVLKNMLVTDNLCRFYSLPDKSKVVWPRKTEQGDSIWGYIKWYDWPEEECKVPCLVLLENEFKDIVSQLDPQRTGFKDVLSKIRKERPQYLHSNFIAKTRQTINDKAEQTPAYRLKISELPIGEDIKQSLLSMGAK